MDNSTGEPQTSVAELPVIIIGSGCTGLAIAHGLKKSTQVDPNTPTKPFDTLKFLNGRTGKVISGIPSPDFYRLRRSKLRALLCKGLDIRWNKRLKDVVVKQDGSCVTAIFEDGEQMTGRLVVGADGSRSTVRELILGPDLAAPLHIPYVSTFVQAKYTREQALFLRSFHPLYIAAIHPDNMVAFFGLQDAPAIDKPEDWTFFFYISWNSTLEQQVEEAKTYGNNERLTQVKSFSRGFTEPWKSAFEWVADQPVWYVDMAVWDPSLPEHTWDTMNGRVTLAGDAAHPMTFQRGQGLNHSMADAGKLVEALTSEPNQSLAIHNYESEMKDRAGEEGTGEPAYESRTSAEQIMTNNEMLN
ncbi:FAD-dependent monooxygenase cctM [Lachnellula arida]|uniref:FAD-dependent monooxygenase cctM n=1 Tax=Lachnellula arida TaxID=1316785 RepID=A0A8T9BK87_9HELO|nr:FAD-dependent monooxygenase cctM [Lachnellula arida]